MATCDREPRGAAAPTRRGFCRLLLWQPLLAATGLLAVPQARAGTRRPAQAIRLEGVAIGMGPILAGRLAAGQPLSLRRQHGHRCVYAGDHLLGWLPHAAADGDRWSLVGHDFDAAGRLSITIAG